MSSGDYRIARQTLVLPAAYAAPRTRTEERLASIWRSVLSMDCVGIHDSYHDLGGDSLLAAVIFSKIEDAFRIEISMGTIVDAPTIAELAAEIDQRLDGGAVGTAEC